MDNYVSFKTKQFVDNSYRLSYAGLTLYANVKFVTITPNTAYDHIDIEPNMEKYVYEAKNNDVYS